MNQVLFLSLLSESRFKVRLKGSAPNGTYLSLGLFVCFIGMKPVFHQCFDMCLVFETVLFALDAEGVE